MGKLKTLQELKYFMELSDLLMIFMHLMMEEKFKSDAKKFTLKNWH